ncbi:DEAD-box ATP-dependent RNA helicase 24-like isoform X1 [Papaver somniferum]|uniref:DEAD-box ATP-dependent RNA helicase 24-like isoform X1 n=1 Tax=Papaver somniferum TaxID=3469 RepID=UPI000E701CFC|nr:DEAD-box ATP-dependent RNA helicase 24-like isoform X1 [Papaver somniferum]XP_026434002.1 DEAD-box ATP-dependent RNA helicase 24-like isoform X1 [Papaver somniferum]
MELPFQWGGGNGRYPYFHGVAGEDRIIIESYPTISASDIEKVRLYSYDWNKKTSTKKAKDGVVSELVSVSLFSKLAFVTLFRSFAESLWPVRGRQFRHQETEKARLRLNVDITAAPDSAPAPAPIESFTNMCLHESIMKDISFHKYSRPTSIQAQAMPVALNGRDLSGCAETGSGKIAAFAIPMIQHCLAQPSVQRGDGPLALGLAPTRERAQQIEKEVRLLIIYHKISGIFAPVLSSYVYYTIRFFVS